MKSTPVYPFSLLFLFMVASTLETFEKLVIPDAGVVCAVDTPTKILPIEEISSVPKCVPASILCSWKCHKEANCTGFNFNVTNNQCELYNYIPTNFVISATCQYFQV